MAPQWNNKGGSKLINYLLFNEQPWLRNICLIYGLLFIKIIIIIIIINYHLVNIRKHINISQIFDYVTKISPKTNIFLHIIHKINNHPHQKSLYKSSSKHIKIYNQYTIIRSISFNKQNKHSNIFKHGHTKIQTYSIIHKINEKMYTKFNRFTKNNKLTIIK